MPGRESKRNSTAEDYRQCQQHRPHRFDIAVDVIICGFAQLSKRDKSAPMEERAYRQSRLCRVLGNPLAYSIVSLLAQHKDMTPGQTRAERVAVFRA